MTKSLLAVAVATTLCGIAAPAFAESDLAFKIDDLNHDKHSGWIFDRMVTLKLGAKCAEKVADKKNAPLAKLATLTRQIQRYALAVSGDDWAKIESQGGNDKEANLKVVDGMVDAFKSKLHITITVEGDDCSVSGSALWTNYMTSVAIALAKYPPKSGTMKATLDVTTKTKVLTAKMNKDGTALAVQAPRDVEPVGWSDTIENEAKRFSSKN